LPPAFYGKSLPNNLIVRSIALDLCAPEFRTGLRQTKETAIMTVPETAIYKYGRS